MIYHAEMEGRVVKQWVVMGSACRFMALAGLLCLALLLSGCGTTYISAPDYGGRYDTSSLGARVAQTARSQIGAHYRLGGTTPKGFDCSGLIWWAYRQHGINVPRVTDAQAKAGYGVGRGIAMRPGDIATAAGIDKDEAGKVIKQLAKEGKIYSPKRCFYDIKT